MSIHQVSEDSSFPRKFLQRCCTKQIIGLVHSLIDLLFLFIHSTKPTMKTLACICILLILSIHWSSADTTTTKPRSPYPASIWEYLMWIVNADAELDKIKDGLDTIQRMNKDIVEWSCIQLMQDGEELKRNITGTMLNHLDTYEIVRRKLVERVDSAIQSASLGSWVQESSTLIELSLSKKKIEALVVPQEFILEMTSCWERASVNNLKQTELVEGFFWFLMITVGIALALLAAFFGGLKFFMRHPNQGLNRSNQKALVAKKFSSS
jgi:hypothetical protein